MKIEDFIGEIDNDEFLKIMYEIFPKKIENVYEKLLSEIKSYLSNVSRLKYISDENENVATVAIYSNEIVDTNSKQLEELEVKMKEALNNKDFVTLSNLSSEASKIQSKIQMVNGMESTTDASIKNSLIASELQSKIEENVNSIKNSLEELESIKVNDKDRLDNLSIYEKHIELIKKMLKSNHHTKRESGIDIDVVTENLVIFLSRFLELKKQVYKTAERVAPIVVKKYDERTTLDSSVETEILESYSKPYSDVGTQDRIYYVISKPDYTSPEFEDNFKELNNVSKNLFYESSIIEMISNNNYEESVKLMETLKESLFDSNPDYCNFLDSLIQKIKKGEIITEYSNNDNMKM